MSTSFRVQDVYESQSVLLTGGTGFLGKVIIEKLLYSIPQIGHVYLLIRPAKGKSPRERLDHITSDPLFDRIRNTKPQAFKKLIPIEGNLMEDNLGLNQHDMQSICDSVSIVIHSAATVKFDEQLRDAVEMNVLGTTRLVALCHKMKHLASVVHVSTAYANCDLPETEEKVYDPPVAPQKLLEALEWMDDDMINSITPKLLGKRPNTYTLTKALAEKQLIEDAGTLPIIIIRPSIVGAIWRDNLPGWTDNINGPTGIFTAVGKGVLTNMCCSASSTADIIPVDIVANMIIVAAAYRATNHHNEVPVMHCSSGDLNPLLWGKIVIFLQQFYHQYPMEQCYSVPSTQVHTHQSMFLLNYYVKHHIPAMALDFVNGLMGRKRVNVKLYAKVWRMVQTLHYFTCHGWKFHAKALPKLWDMLCDEDKQTFHFDVRDVNWDEYLCDYVMGIKRYLLKEKIENIPLARANLRKLKFYRFLLTAAVWGVLVRFLGANYKKNQKYAAWFMGVATTQFIQTANFRPVYPLKSLEQYKQEMKAKQQSN